MEKESINGLMAESILEGTMRTKKMGLEFISGSMEGGLKGNGEKGKEMVLEKLYILQDNKSMDFGSMIGDRNQELP